MEKRDPLKELGNTQDKNEPQEATAKEQKLAEAVVTAADKENASGKVEHEKPEIDLDVGCGSRRPNLRLSFLKAFDPLYSQSPEKSAVTEEHHLKPPVRQQLIIEDSDVSDSSQLSPLPADVSDDEAVYVDAACAIDSNEASDKQIAENRHPNLEESLLQFYTPEKLNTTLLHHSENVPKPTSQLTDSESVLPKLLEPVSTSESNLPHIEKRKLHSDHSLEHNVPSPVVVPCKKQRITEREIVAAIRFKLQLDRSDEESVAIVDAPECEKHKSAETKETDEDFQNKEDALSTDTEISNTDNVEGDDSNSGISEIKTDSPDKSVKETFADKNLNSEVSGEQYPELPETSEESSKVLVSKSVAPKPVEKSSEVGWSSCDDYPELPETSDESSKGLPVNDTSAPNTVDTSPPTKPERCTVPAKVEKQPEQLETSDESSAELLVNKTLAEVPKTTEEKIIFTSAERDLILQASKLENYPDLPETSDESFTEQLGNKTFEEPPKTTEEKIIPTSSKIGLFLQGSDLEDYPDLPETSDESSAERLGNKTFEESLKTTEERASSTSTKRDVFLEASNLDNYPDLPETSDESTAEILVNNTFEEIPRTILSSTNPDVILQACNVERYPSLPETSDESSAEQLVNKTFEEVAKTNEEKTISTSTNQDVVLQAYNLDKHLNLPETSDESSDELLKNRTFQSSPRKTEEEKFAVKEINLPIINVEKYPDLPETSDESTEEPLVTQTVVEAPKTTEKETVKETVELPHTAQDNSKVIGESSKSDKDKGNKEVIKKLSKEELSQEDFAAEKSKEVRTLLEEKHKDIPSPSKEKPSLESTGEESSAEKPFPTQLEENPLKPTEAVIFDIKSKKEFINSSTKQKTDIEEKADKEATFKPAEEEHKSARDLPKQKVEENVNTSFDSRIPTDLKELDSGVESNEELYCKSPVGEREKSSDDEDNSKEECTVESDRQVSSDEDTKTISEDTIQNDQTALVTETNENIKTEENLENLKSDKEKPETDSEKSINKINLDVESFKSKMADLSEKLSLQLQENSDLKLQLNASQQAKASLELEIRQKEEIIIKTQAEAMKNEQVYKQEIKQLREKLKENSKLIEKDSSKELEEQLKEAKAREAKAIAELNQRNKDDLNYQKIMEEYENTIATRFADYQKLKEEHETATRHLANIEFAFSDVHQKYERTKTVVEGYKSNEETLVLSLQASEKTCKQHEERYESLKAHAKAQIEKSNKEILMLRDKYEMDINKLKAIIKRLEIKCGSLEVSLQQKTEECAALSALCDEVTGKRM